MKLGIMSDLHLGLRQYGLRERESDFYQQFDKAIDTFIRFNTDIVIIAGDIFDQPRPSPRALYVFADGLNLLNQNNIAVYNIVGNHSMVQSKDFITADNFLEKITNYQLLDVDNFYEDEDIFLSGLPYFYSSKIEELVERVNSLNQLAGKSSSKIKVLVLHQAFKEYCGFLGEDLSIHDLDISNFDLVVSGHIHQKLITDLEEGKVFLQPGSLERCNLTEARDEENEGKGIFIIDTDRDISAINISDSFIRISSDRRFLIADMYINEEQDIEDMKNEILQEVSHHDLAPILFLTVHDITGSFTRLLDMTKDFNNVFLTVNFNYFDENLELKANTIETDGVLSVREALKIALNPLNEDEAKLGMDLYDSLKNDEDVQALLDDFLEKRKTKSKENQIQSIDLEEMKNFFENL